MRLHVVNPNTTVAMTAKIAAAARAVALAGTVVDARQPEMGPVSIEGFYDEAFIGEAGFHIASLVAARFAVVTTLGVSIVPIEHNLRKYGLAERCARVRAAEVPVLALEERNADALAKISAEITAAIRDDRAEAIVLGCAGMADLAAELAATHGLPVVDGVAAAVTLAESLLRLGLKTSRLGPYAAPRPKTYDGLLSGFRP